MGEGIKSIVIWNKETSYHHHHFIFFSLIG